MQGLRGIRPTVITTIISSILLARRIAGLFRIQERYPYQSQPFKIATYTAVPAKMEIKEFLKNH